MSNHNCNCCRYVTDTKQSYERHIKSKRHLRLTALHTEGRQNELFTCNTCKKFFAYNTGLSRHASKCTTAVVPTDAVVSTTAMVSGMQQTDASEIKNLLVKLTNDFAQFKQQITPIVNVDVGQITNHTTNNNNYNIEKAILYLNTERSDVTPMRDVIENMEMTEQDIQMFDTETYAQAATEMFFRAYLAIPKKERPFFSFIKDDGTHGSEVTVKGEEKWHYETNTDMTLYRGVSRVADINMHLLFRCIDELCIKINVEISDRCDNTPLKQKITEMRCNPKIYTKTKALICHDICCHNDAVFDD